jgi:hypothetical protein
LHFRELLHGRTSLSYRNYLCRAPKSDYASLTTAVFRLRREENHSPILFIQEHGMNLMDSNCPTVGMLVVS